MPPAAGGLRPPDPPPGEKGGAAVRRSVDDRKLKTGPAVASAAGLSGRDQKIVRRASADARRLFWGRAGESRNLNAAKGTEQAGCRRLGQGKTARGGRGAGVRQGAFMTQGGKETPRDRWRTGLRRGCKSGVGLGLWGGPGRRPGVSRAAGRMSAMPGSVAPRRLETPAKPPPIRRAACRTRQMKKDFRVAIPEVLFLNFRSWRKDDLFIATGVPRCENVLGASYHAVIMSINI